MQKQPAPSPNTPPVPDLADANSARQRNLLLGYLLMTVAGIFVFFAIRHAGNQLNAPAAQNGFRFGQTAEQVKPNTLPQVLLGLVIILIASRLVGTLFRRFRQPPVIGEVLAGILLGPSLLGQIAPSAVSFLFPSSSVPLLSILAQIGVLLFMFLVGLDLNTRKLRQHTSAALAISHASILAPFLLGAGLSLFLYPRLSSSDVPFTAFALFLGVSMSVTAFPVLARILTDRQLHRTRLGTVAMTCAAVDDVTAWCLLAFVVGVIHSSLGGAVLTTLLTLIYLVVMLVVVRPLLLRLTQRFTAKPNETQAMMATVFIGLLLSSLATEMIGIHALFGAFFFGAMIPHDSPMAHTLLDKLEDFVVIMLLPAFFAITGLRTQIGLVVGAQWLVCGLIILTAFAGKFGGSTLAARWTGLSWRDSAALGILMNTRGLMELIVLNIGLDLKVLSPRLFAMMVIMAVVTTFATTPILDRLVSHSWDD